MATEIERKFLVVGDDWRQSQGFRLIQGYLHRSETHTVRVRIAGDQAWLAVKGRPKGITRAEFEYTIPVEEARALLEFCAEPPIDKVRREITFEGNVWEVDEFFGSNAGLVVAEIELDDEAQPFARPPWVDQEVTHDPRYLNSNLVRCPFAQWTK